MDKLIEYLRSGDSELEAIGLELLKYQNDTTVDKVVEIYNREIDNPKNNDELRDGMAEFQYNREDAMKTE